MRTQRPRAAHPCLSMLTLCVPLGACGGAASTPIDAGAAEVALTDAGPPPDLGSLEPLRVQSALDAPGRLPALGCLGRYTAPPPATRSSELRAEVRDFQLEATVANLALRVRFGGDLAGDCPSPQCETRTTDAQGGVALWGEPGSALTLELLAAQRGPNDALNPTRTIVYDLLAPPRGETLRVTSISEATRRYMPQSAGLSVTNDAAQGMGVVRDCNGEPLMGAIVRVFDGAMEVPLGAQGPGVAYTSVVHRPDRAQRSTNFNGQFVVVNLPPDHAYRFEAWGVPPGASQPRRVACAVLPAWSAAVTWRDLLPLRVPSAREPCSASP